jgi:hypothetical protein
MNLRTLAIALPLLLALALAAGCGGDEQPAPSSGGPGASGHDDHAHEAGPHGGSLIVTSDHQLHVEVLHDEDAARMRLFVLDGDLKPLALEKGPVLRLVGQDGSAQVQGERDAEGAWVFDHALLAGEPEGSILVTAGGKTWTPRLEHAHEHDEHEGHDHGEDGHEHDEGRGPHGGVLAPLGADGAWLELKLHDDKGDLELWLARDRGITQPFDLPVDTVVTARFDAPRAQDVALRVRNADRNEDEDGAANVRAGRTNYFVFPGETGVDASWLQGASFRGRVVVRAGGLESAPFDLEPHTHGEHDHDHR